VCYVTKIEGGFEFAAPVFEYGAVPVSFEFDYLNFEIKWSVRDSNNVLVYAGFISGAELAAASSVAPESVPSSGALLTASLSPAPEWYDGNGWCGYTETAAGTEYVCDAPFLYHFTGRFSLSFTSASGLPGLALPNFDRGYTLSVEPSGGPTPIQFFWSSYGHFVQDQNSAGYDVFSAYGGGDLTTAQNQFRDIQNFRPPLQWGAPGYGQSSFECEVEQIQGCIVYIAIDNNPVGRPPYPRTLGTFTWKVVDLFSGEVLFQGEVAPSEFTDNYNGAQQHWHLPDSQGLIIDRPVQLFVEESGAPHPPFFLITATIFSDDTYFASGYDDFYEGSWSICYPQFDCSGDLDPCLQG
jgi:hypothetical protein